MTAVSESRRVWHTSGPKDAGYSFMPGCFSQKASQLLYTFYRSIEISITVTRLSLHQVIMVTWDHSIFNKQLTSYRKETVCGLTKNRTWTAGKLSCQQLTWNDDVFMSYIIQAIMEAVHIFVFYSVVRIFAVFPSLCSSLSSIFITSPSSCD